LSSTARLKRLRPAELHSNFATESHRVAQHCDSFHATASVEQTTCLQFQTLRLKAARAELMGEPHGPFEVTRHRVILA
jgi:hypothetical protein